MGFIVQSSVDGGVSWEDCSGPFKTENEAINKKKEIDCHIDLTVDLRVVSRDLTIWEQTQMVARDFLAKSPD